MSESKLYGNAAASVKRAAQKKQAALDAKVVEEQQKISAALAEAGKESELCAYLAQVLSWEGVQARRPTVPPEAIKLIEAAIRAGQLEDDDKGDYNYLWRVCEGLWRTGQFGGGDWKTSLDESSQLEKAIHAADVYRSRQKWQEL